METGDQHLITMIHHIRILISQIKLQTGLTFGEYYVLCMIAQNQQSYDEGITPTELNRILGTKKPATSRMLTTLERKDYITRTRQDKDQRISYLSITSKGRQVFDKEKEEFGNKFEHIVSKIGAQQFEELLHSMELLEVILEDEFNVHIKKQKI